MTTQFGGDDTGMAIQPDGKIVMVGGSTSDFVLARYNTNGSLDTTFGTNGFVTHSMLGGTSEEIARAVAIQPDGKIVVAGHTGQFGRPGRPAGNRFDHAIVRYNANGSVDTTFGAGGVASALIGRIFAMALQADGGIIVVGDAPLPEDMMVARYNPNGNLDLTFGQGGFRLFDLDPLGAELAENVAVQSNGAIVLSGPHTRPGETEREQHTAVVRLDSGGDPDGTFGTEGVLVMLQHARQRGAGRAKRRTHCAGRRHRQCDTGYTEVRDDAAERQRHAGQLVRHRRQSDHRRSRPEAIRPRQSRCRPTARSSSPAAAITRRIRTSQPCATTRTARWTRASARPACCTVDFFGFTDIAENVAIAPDGKIVLGGLARDNVDGYGLARVNP